MQKQQSSQNFQIHKLPLRSNLTPNFQDELEQRLKFIPAKQQLSNRKLHPHKILQAEQYTFENRNHPRQKQSNLNCLSSVSEYGPKKINFTSIQDESSSNFGQNLSAQKQKKLQEFKSNLTQEDQLSQMLAYFFEGSKKVQLKDFIKASLMWYFKDQNFDIQFRKKLEEECCPFICTAQPQYISLSAINILIKKINIKIFLHEKILNVQYKQRKEKLEKQYDAILAQLMSQQSSIQEQFQELRKKQVNLDNLQKSLGSKNKSIKQKQKELLQKQKNIKKAIQEKGQKMVANMVSQIQKIAKDIDKKTNLFQRNARNKLQLIEKRALDVKKVPNKDTHESQEKSQHDIMLKKYQNEILSMKSKAKKYEKQQESKLERLKKQLKASQDQSNSLLKANAILQNKLNKVKAKMKNENEESIKREEKLCQFIQQKNDKILELQTLINTLQMAKAKHSKQSQHQKYNNTKHEQATRMKSSVSQKQNQKHERFIQNPKNTKHNNFFNQTTTNSNQCQNCQLLLDCIERIIDLIVASINQYRRQNLQNYVAKDNSKFPSYQEMLLSNSKNILRNISNVLFIAIEQEATVLMKKTIEFGLNLFLAKCSFLKFTEITEINNASFNFNNELKYVESEIKQTCEISAFRNGINEKQLGSFLRSAKQEQSPVQFANLLVILSIFGMDQVASPDGQELVKISDMLNELILTDLSSNKLRQNYQAQQELQRFQSQEYTTFFFSRFLLNYSSCNCWLEVLLQLCSSGNPDIPIFKSMMALQNYRYLIKVLIGFQSDTQILEKVSIILQRLCYFYAQNIKISEFQLIKIVQVLERQKNQRKQAHSILLISNLQSIVSSLSQLSQT